MGVTLLSGIPVMDNVTAGNVALIGYDGRTIVNGPDPKTLKIYKYTFSLGSNNTNFIIFGQVSKLYTVPFFTDNTSVIGYEFNDSSKVISVNYTIDSRELNISCMLAPGATNVMLDLYVAFTDQQT